ncbi:hypothetical protein GFK26_18090 [Variovorax paradoxus]|uniref:Uncharacterized protein n=1 Tax=Variovorax paradoxus TaxID=34073 RepID=A0A5Q0M459_VARPD|nr:hypothetical protein [Variovorax paradoxus]QFZ84540.1 hypothetical protein GFK26_18090 [Variovorax paradoxus]
MSDIKKFTGFLSSDGKTHNTQKAAVTHELELKTKKALADSFGDKWVYNGEDRLEDQSGTPLDAFLYENRDAVLAALSQEVLLRKKRTPKVKATTPASAQAPASAPSAPPADSTPVRLQDGIFDADS